jgi:hypothetical protein
VLVASSVLSTKFGSGRKVSTFKPYVFLAVERCITQMQIDYNNRKFKPVSNSDNGEVSTDMVFQYQQVGNVLTCTYNGKNIIKGHVIGLVDETGCIQMSYHQVNRDGKLMTGICSSKPELINGKIRLYETWQWTSGDQSEGVSILDEI